MIRDIASLVCILINHSLLLLKYGRQQLCVAENGEVGDRVLN